jgi:tRNA A-37 threonylcarbamoyl transferase component Bud32
MADPMLTTALQEALQQSPQRVQPLDLPDGRRFWLKQLERPSLRMRLQKGDPKKSFLRELNGLLLLGSKGLAVPAVVAHGPGHFVIKDAGTTLRDLLVGRAAMRLEAFRAAGTALAKLHVAGYCHGRPAIRDICWDNATTRFIDLERFSPQNRSMQARAVDLLVMIHSLYADALRPGVNNVRDEVFETLFAYRRAAPPGVWETAQRLAKWLQFLAPISRLRKGSREWAAITPTLAAFSEL